MHIIIPMAGYGQRFLDAGYKNPKPLIEVDGRPMIEHVAGLFGKDDRFSFICKEPDLKATGMEAVLRRIRPGGAIIPIPEHRKGPVVSALEALVRGLDVRHEPTVINYCDFGMDWDYEDFKRFAGQGHDGAIICYTGFHPHHLGSTFYGYAKCDGQGRLIEIREKEPFTADPMSEHAAAGSYYFKDGIQMLKYFTEQVAKGIHKNGEYYASLPYNLMTRDGLDTRVYDVPKFMQWGTPEDLREYQVWSDHFAYDGHRRGAICDEEVRLFQQRFPKRTPEQLRKTAEYWQEYFRKVRGA